jgi:hypothetical protein
MSLIDLQNYKNPKYIFLEGGNSFYCAKSPDYTFHFEDNFYNSTTSLGPYQHKFGLEYEEVFCMKPRQNIRTGRKSLKINLSNSELLLDLIMQDKSKCKSIGCIIKSNQLKDFIERYNLFKDYYFISFSN